EGIISEKEITIIKDNISRIINHKELEVFFSGQGTVLNEQTIIDSEFGNIKPDKIVLIDSKAFLLDYKTGDKKNSYIHQMNNYAEALERMNYEVVKKALVYIGDK